MNYECPQCHKVEGITRNCTGCGYYDPGKCFFEENRKIWLGVSQQKNALDHYLDTIKYGVAYQKFDAASLQLEPIAVQDVFIDTINEPDLLITDIDYIPSGKEFNDAYGKAIAEELERSLPFWNTLFSNTLPIKTASPCEHSWTHYDGFTDSFDFCTKCDRKRDI